MTSAALLHKIARQRAQAAQELPKARLCARVVLALLADEAQFHQAEAELKAALGGNWSYVTAVQFMSGRQARLCADCASPQEQEPMLLAHQLAESLCIRVCERKFGFAELRLLMQDHLATAAGDPSPATQRERS